MLDLGCGPGSIAIPFAGDFEQVIGVDPEPTMLDEARKQSEKTGAQNILWVLGKAEDVSPELRPVRLTTMGRSFHWMNQAEVLRRIYDVTEKDGGVVISAESAPVWRYEEGEESWKKVYKDLVRKYLGPQRRAGGGVYTPPRDFEKVLDESPFGKHESWEHRFTRPQTPETILGFLYSSSFAQKEFFGDRREDFERELHEGLLKQNPSGNFTENVTLEVLLAKK